MKDQNKLIIGVVAIIVVAYFLFFKQKEGFTVNKGTREIIPEEVMIYTYLIAPLKLGHKHPDVIKAREFYERMGFSRDKLMEFENNMDFIEKKYSAMLADMKMMPSGPGPVEHVVDGVEGATLVFKCPVRSGFIMYGFKDRQLRYNIPEGTTVLTINNNTMRGDPAPRIRKSWSAKYVC